jgi:hypothetical protein
VGAHPLLTAGVTAARFDPQARGLWVAAVHVVVRESGGRVIGSVMAPGPGHNYDLVHVQLADGRPVRLLLNARIGLVAAADDPGPSAIVATFCDVPRPDVFTLHGFRVADPADMEAPLTDDQAVELTDAERRDIAYHRPLRVGDVIFNWFD